MTTKYEVWGYDTFADEDYLCGTFNSKSEALKKMREMEHRAQGQDVSLRDTFEVLEVTEDVEIERSLREAELDRMKNADMGYDPDFLSLVIHQLFKQLRNTKETGKRIKVEYDSTKTNDCFDKIILTMITLNEKEQAIDVEIQLRKGEFYSSGTISKIPYKIPKSDFQGWLNSKYAPKIICMEVEKMIKSFYFD